MRLLLVLVFACSESGAIARVPAQRLGIDAAIASETRSDRVSADAPRRAVDIPDDCTATVLGKPFRGARMLCLAAAAMAHVSLALEDGRDIRQPLEALLDKALEPATRAPFDTGTTRVGDRELPASVLYRGLLGMIAVGFDRVGATPIGLDVDALAASLVGDLERWYVASYRDGIWPCDHAPAAAFLRLHGRLRGNAASMRAADGLAMRLGRLLVDGFPTRVDRRGRVVDGTQRSTPLAFTAAYLLPAEPELARAFATALVANCDRAPVAACREWKLPRRRDHRRLGDLASGPIVAGYSVGATALAIVATRALDDDDWNAALLATAALVGRDRLGTLERALLAWGETARAW